MHTFKKLRMPQYEAATPANPLYVNPIHTTAI